MDGDFNNLLSYPFGKWDVCASYLGVLRKDAIPYSFYDRQICTTDMPVINCLVNRTFFSRLRFIGTMPRFVLYDKI
jgi:hypothetical protein